MIASLTQTDVILFHPLLFSQWISPKSWTSFSQQSGPCLWASPTLLLQTDSLALTLYSTNNSFSELAFGLAEGRTQPETEKKKKVGEGGRSPNRNPFLPKRNPKKKRMAVFIPSWLGQQLFVAEKPFLLLIFSSIHNPFPVWKGWKKDGCGFYLFIICLFAWFFVNVIFYIQGNWVRDHKGYTEKPVKKRDSFRKHQLLEKDGCGKGKEVVLFEDLFLEVSDPVCWRCYWGWVRSLTRDRPKRHESWENAGLSATYPVAISHCFWR